MRSVHTAPDSEAVEAALHQLSPRAEDLLRKRFGIGMSTGHRRNDLPMVSGRRLRDLEASAFRRLRLNALAS